MKVCCAVLVCLLATTSLALVQVVSVDPVKASWRGAVDTLPPNNVVGQGIVCNFDTPVYAEFFTGTATTQQYQVQLKLPSQEIRGRYPYYATRYRYEFVATGTGYLSQARQPAGNPKSMRMLALGLRLRG